MTLLRLALLLALCLMAGRWLRTLVDPGAAAGQVMDLGAALPFLALYTFLLAVPFVPGVEIGLILLAALGPGGAPVVWLATVAGLSLAFALGRLVPPRRAARLLRRIGARRGAALVRHLGALDPARRRALVGAAVPRPLAPLLTRWRWLLLAVVIALPGNAVLGGGGGIAFLTGLVRLHPPAGFMLTAAVATLPLPLAVMLLGHLPTFAAP